MGIVVSVREVPHFIDEMLGVNVRIPDSFDDLRGTSDVLLDRSCSKRFSKSAKGIGTPF